MSPRAPRSRSSSRRSVAEGTSVEKFFSEKLPNRDSQDYLIRVNRQPVPRDYVFQDGDRVTMTSVKIEGAA